MKQGVKQCMAGCRVILPYDKLRAEGIAHRTQKRETPGSSTSADNVNFVSLHPCQS